MGQGLRSRRIEPADLPSTIRPPDMHVTAVDSDPLTLHLIETFLGSEEWRISTHSRWDDRDCDINQTDALLLNVRMHHTNGLDVLQEVRGRRPDLAVVVLTGTDDVKDAVCAMQRGAFEFLPKPFNRPTLTTTVRSACEATRGGAIASTVVTPADASAPDGATARGDETCWTDPAKFGQQTPVLSSSLRQQLHSSAASHATIFIGGETGTGKSTVAREIHRASPRSNGPFIPINCSAIPDSLMHSELFGHVKGAFTGASNDRIGQFEAAAGGTLFLDEIGDLPLDLQPKLLTFLQDRSVRPLGMCESREVDVRLITATHRDLSAMCREGSFRQDLFFRLMVLRIELAPLRERRDEFVQIAAGVLGQLCRRNSISPRRLDEEAVAMLKVLPWRGNIRELENVLERSLALCPNEVLTVRDVFAGNPDLDRRTSAATSASIEQPFMTAAVSDIDGGVAGGVASTGSAAIAPSTEPSGYRLAGRTLAEIERDAIVATLRLTTGNKARAARTLGISEKSVYNKMKRLKIEPSAYQLNVAPEETQPC